MHYYLRKNLFVWIKEIFKFNILQNYHSVTNGVNIWMQTAEKASPDLANKGNILGLDITEKGKQDVL